MARYLFLFSFLCLRLFAAETALVDAAQLSLTIDKPGHDSRITLSENYPELHSVEIDVKQRRADIQLLGEFPVLETVEIDTSWGQVWTKFHGTFDQLREINVQSGSGRVVLDLRGDWKCDCVVHVKSVDGRITVKLPQDIGVIVHPSVAQRYNLFQNGLKRAKWWSNDTLTNPEWGESPITLEVFVESQSGNVLLETNR